jgi:hypothetical protein
VPFPQRFLLHHPTTQLFVSAANIAITSQALVDSLLTASACNMMELHAVCTSRLSQHLVDTAANGADLDLKLVKVCCADSPEA